MPWGRTLLVLAVVLAGCAAFAALLLWMGNGGHQVATGTPAPASAAPVVDEPNQPAGVGNPAAESSEQSPSRPDTPRRSVRRGGDRGPAAPGGPPRITRRPEKVRETGPAVGSTGAGAADAPGGEAPTPVPDDEPPPEPEDDDESKNGLAGWVFDEAGSGVPGLSVSAKPRRLVRPAQGSLEGTVAETGGEGFFAFVGLAEGEYALATEGNEQYEPASGVFSTGENAAVLVVRSKADRRATVRGYVESRDGGSLSGVRVQPVGQFENTAASDDQGAYAVTLRLHPQRGSQMLRYQLDGFREHRLTIGPSELEAGAEIYRDVVLEPLRETTTVSGSVTGTDGSPVHRAHVQLMSSSLGRRADGASDRDGLFAIPDVEHADDYRLWVRPPSGYKDYQQHDLVVTGWVDLDIVLEKVERATLEGRMIDPDGRPVPRITLWLTTAQPRQPRTTPVTGDDAGWFSVEGLPEGGASLATRATPFFSFSGIELPPRDVKTVRLQLDTGRHQLAGWVRGSDGAPVVLAAVQLLWSSMENGVRSRSKRDTVTDANGYFLFTRLGAGPHLLTVSANGFQTTRMQVDVLDVNEDLTIELPRLPE